jgi:PEGA domain-containing protein
MKHPRFSLILATGLVLLLASPASPLMAAGGGKGGHSSTGAPAASPSPSGGNAHSSSGSSGGSSGGSAPERGLGRNGGLNRSHGHSSTHVVVGWPWWGGGWGWGWGWPYYYGYWGGYYPAYAYPRVAPPDSMATLELHVSPRKASVRLDGYEVGQARDFNDAYTPLFLTEGDHVVELAYEGYKTLKVRVRGSEGASLNLHYDLEKGEGVDSRSETAEMAPPPVAPSPALPPSMSGPAGPPGQDAAPSPDTRGTLRTGMIRIRVEPGDAAVYLDGEFLGTAAELSQLHGALSVAAGDHKVEAVRPGYGSRTLMVTVREGQPETVKLDLSIEPRN